MNESRRRVDGFIHVRWRRHLRANRSVRPTAERKSLALHRAAVMRPLQSDNLISSH